MQLFLLALSLNSDIRSKEPVFPWKRSEYYVFCECIGSKSLFNVQDTLFKNIQLTEYSKNTIYKEYAIFHTLKCKQYQQDSTEDQQQIQD